MSASIGHDGSVISCGSGVAVGFDLSRTAVIAASRALAELTEPPVFACVFARGGTPEDVAAALAAAQRTIGAVHSIGCSSSHGVIGGGHGIEDVSAVSVFVAGGEGLSVRSFHLEVMPTPESIAVVGLPPLEPDDQVAIVLADAYSFPVEGFVEQSAQSLGGLPVAGGLAVGGQGSGSTRLLIDGRVVDRGAVGVVLGGSVSIEAVVSQGCRPVGHPMTVTRCDGNIVLELAGRPALQRLEDLLLTLSPEDQAIAGTGLQIGVVHDEYADQHEQGDFLIRSLVRVDSDRRALVIADDVQVGQTVSFQLRDAEAASADLQRTLARWSRPAESRRPSGALLFSCNGRGERFFATSDHDALTVRDELGGAEVAGYFAAGEIGPVAGRNYLHGFSASVVVFDS
ncbi:MAG: FIST C-terminal domain-containing protein [Actinomycetia bacterium]|nr:FIST C-terminal domain-containing protein [Actinomycetes bacterium]